MIPTDLDILARPVAHLPFVRAVIDELGFLDVIDEHCPKHTLNRVSDAECVLALVLNVLCGRPALYRMDEWLAKLDVDVLFGEGADASAFNDTRLGLALDHLDEAGTDTVMAAVARDYLERRDDWTFSVHHDTTSVSLYGAYDLDPVADQPTPAKGYSKDHRPDLKQLIYGLTLHGAAGIPLVATVMDGNTSDTRVARDHLSKLLDLLPDEREVTFVGDCKVVDGRTLGRLLREGLHVVSLLPKSFGVRQEVVEAAFAEAHDPKTWPLLVETPGRLKGDPPRQYRGRSFTRPLRVQLEKADGTDGTESFEEMRFLVISSDNLGEQFDQKLEKTFGKERGAVEKAVTRANRKGFACEADARAAAESIATKAPLHRAEFTIRSEEERVKRAKPGRPPKGEPPAFRTVYRIDVELQPDEERVTSARHRASCFVLVTDWLEEEWDDARVLSEYRHQHIIEGHTGFRWLKGPAAVAPVFLKSPSRIRAMGLVLILALMVRNYIQAKMRAELAERGETLPHPFTKKPEARLTTEMAFEHFGGLLTQVVTLGDHRRRMPIQLTDPARKLLSLFGMSEAIFSPRRLRSDEKCRGPTAKTPGM